MKKNRKTKLLAPKGFSHMYSKLKSNNWDVRINPNCYDIEKEEDRMHLLNDLMFLAFKRALLIAKKKNFEESVVLDWNISEIMPDYPPHVLVEFTVPFLIEAMQIHDADELRSLIIQRKGGVTLIVP